MTNPTHTPTPLEPCPFCGGKASVIKGRVGSQFGQELNYVAVGCWSEGCKIRPHINGRPDWENKWIEEWNVRAPYIVKCVNECEPLLKQYQDLVAWADTQVGTPCEQIRHKQLVEELVEALNEVRKLTSCYAGPKRVDGVTSSMEQLHIKVMSALAKAGVE